ncbi:hypothetical protein KLP40_17980 [Hymenobacter sp. NST-14]|uniref:helix-turn-helix domain-containing protein n=1 Tax=Hymenobacter piscis TaxID=2839984 RepID=UPI001C031C7D|nr:hypothetical protein [Hymenobacter piscis]MBT9395061.1 hypothetical protein [Hymenobacter piscis]
MQPYSLDLRIRVGAACAQVGSRQQQAAERFGVSVSFIKKLSHQQRQTGSLAAKPASGGPARSIFPSEQTWLVAYVGQHADATLAELNAAWQAAFSRPVGQTSIWNVLDEHGLRRKKKQPRQ